MRVYYDRDADLNLIKSKKVSIIGYGSQGFAHANNLKESGVEEVAVGLRPGSASAAKVEAAGLTVMDIEEAARFGDVVMLLTPDELQRQLYADVLHGSMKEGAALAFAHGLNIHFRLIEPRPDLDVFIPLGNDVLEFTSHRSFTHSLPVMAAAANGESAVGGLTSESTA